MFPFIHLLNKEFPMKKIVTSLCAVATVLLTFSALAQVVSTNSLLTPYAGEQMRGIKSLSENDIAGLLAGQGASMAKAAELNGYPGPAHTLELKDPLHLTAEQVLATEALMAAHKARARELGAALVHAERQLDTLFASRSADAGAVEQAVQNVGRLQAQLRAEHLQTHLTQTALLTDDQIARYSLLRGYADPKPVVISPAGGTQQHQRAHH